MAIPVFFILVATTLVLTFLPVLRPREPLEETGGSVRRRIQALEQEKSSHLQAIRDVEFERKIGKVSDEDYAELKEHYTWKAAETLKALEQLHREERRERKRT